MLKSLRQFFNSSLLLKVTSYNAIGVVVKLATGLVSSKVIAFYLGAAGMALLGDLRNFMTSVHSISTLGIYNGIVKYVSEFKNDASELKAVLSTSLLLNMLASVILALVLFFGAGFWNNLIFKETYDFAFIFRLTGLAIPFYTLYLYSQALLNGLAKHRLLINIGIVGNILTLIGSVTLIYYYRIHGAFVIAVISPVIALGITVLAVFGKRRFLTNFSLGNFKVGYLRKFTSYAGMTAFSAAVSPVVFMLIRQEIINQEGLTAAGYWDAMTRLSDYYMMFGTTILTLYILPKLSEIVTTKAFRREIFHFYKTILPLFAIGAVVVYFLRTFIVQIVFTADFLPMETLFQWQLVGDFFKLASVVIAYQFVAKNMFYYFIITQIISLGTIYLSSVFFIDLYGVNGATMSHAFSYCIYFVMMLFIFRNSLFGNND
ncbi:MAG: O-antigen translocase [Leeuwenhoekiella sp.]